MKVFPFMTLSKTELRQTKFLIKMKCSQGKAKYREYILILRAMVRNLEWLPHNIQALLQ